MTLADLLAPLLDEIGADGASRAMLKTIDIPGAADCDRIGELVLVVDRRLKRLAQEKAAVELKLASVEEHATRLQRRLEKNGD